MAKSSMQYQVQVQFTSFVNLGVSASSLEDAIQKGRDILADSKAPFFSDLVVDVISVEDARVTGAFEA